MTRPRRVAMHTGPVRKAGDDLTALADANDKAILLMGILYPSRLDLFGRLTEPVGLATSYGMFQQAIKDILRENRDITGEVGKHVRQAADNLGDADVEAARQTPRPPGR